MSDMAYIVGHRWPITYRQVSGLPTMVNHCNGNRRCWLRCVFSSLGSAIVQQCAPAQTNPSRSSDSTLFLSFARLRASSSDDRDRARSMPDARNSSVWMEADRFIRRKYVRTTVFDALRHLSGRSCCHSCNVDALVRITDVTVLDLING